MKVINRSDGIVGYELPELNIRRVFNPGESKDIKEEEINSLFQQDGGAVLVRQFLIIEDEEWVNRNYSNAPVEYFWKVEDIKKCLLEDELDLFVDTLQYAPLGVLELIKSLSWKLPLRDLNKVQAILEHLGFDVLKAIDVMSSKVAKANTPAPERLRKRKE